MGGNDWRLSVDLRCHFSNSLELFQVIFSSANWTLSGLLKPLGKAVEVEVVSDLRGALETNELLIGKRVHFV